MKIKLLLDEDVHVILAEALRKRGYDVFHVSELNRNGKSDDEQLRYAGKEKRCLVSFNVRDFVLLHHEYVRFGREHCGIIVSKQLTVGQTLHKLLSLLQLCSYEAMKNHIEFL